MLIRGVRMDMDMLTGIRATVKGRWSVQLLIASSVLWIALGHETAPPVAASANRPLTTPCFSDTSKGTPLESLTMQNAMDVAPIAGLGHAVRYMGKPLTSGLQLNGGVGLQASGGFTLNGRYSHLVGIAYEDDANKFVSSLRFVAGSSAIYLHDFTGTHDKVSFDIDVHGLKSFTITTGSSVRAVSVDVVAYLVK